MGKVPQSPLEVDRSRLLAAGRAGQVEDALEGMWVGSAVGHQLQGKQSPGEAKMEDRRETGMGVGGCTHSLGHAIMVQQLGKEVGGNTRSFGEAGMEDKRDVERELGGNMHPFGEAEPTDKQEVWKELGGSTHPFWDHWCTWLKGKGRPGCEGLQQWVWSCSASSLASCSCHAQAQLHHQNTPAGFGGFLHRLSRRHQNQAAWGGGGEEIGNISA